MLLSACNDVQSLGENGDGGASEQTELESDTGGKAAMPSGGTMGYAGKGGGTSAGGKASFGGSPTAGYGGSDAAGTGGSDNGECCVREGQGIIWVVEQGEPNLRTEYAVTGCGDFTSTAFNLQSCKSQLPACDPSIAQIDADRLSAVLAHPDVVTAVDERPLKVFGGPAHPDQASLEVLTGRGILVINRCSGAHCEPLPEGIRQLVITLDALAAQQSALGNCAPDPACYEPVDSDTCEAQSSSFAYRAEHGRCEPVVSAGCGEDNQFETQEDCAAACWTDPCRMGTAPELTPPEDCAAMGGGRCFPHVAHACACSCAREGLAFTACTTTRTAIPQTICMPD